MSDVRGVGDAAAPPAQPRRRHLAPMWTLKANQMLGAAAFACLAKYLPIYFAGINLPLNIIGILSSLGMCTTFVGQLFWSAVIDWMGEYKRTLVFSQVTGTASLFLYTIPYVQQTIPLVFAVATLNTFLMSTGGSIIDAMCMKVLDDYKKAVRPDSTPRTVRGSQETYGDQRLYSAVGWGGMSLIMGQIIDMFGLNAMFVGFAVLQTVNVSIVVGFMPGSKDAPQQGETTEGAASDSGAGRPLCNATVLWFFTNLMVYGICMCLIENFLFLYLVKEFDNTPNVLLGASTAVMCFFEIPVFKYLGPFIENPERGERAITLVLFLCQAITAARCWMYIMIPKDAVWLSILISPFHGVCFAAMWAASMEFAKRLAGPRNLAKMTGLVNGLYYNVSMGIGSVFWGLLVTAKKDGGIGFVASFELDMAILTLWSIIWQLGLAFLSKRSRVAAPDCQESLAGRDLPAGA